MPHGDAGVPLLVVYLMGINSNNILDFQQQMFKKRFSFASF